MNDAGPVIVKKESIEKEDGRCLILYTFDSDEVEVMEEDTDSESRETRYTQR